MERVRVSQANEVDQADVSLPAARDHRHGVGALGENSRRDGETLNPERLSVEAQLAEFGAIDEERYYVIVIDGGVARHALNGNLELGCGTGARVDVRQIEHEVHRLLGHDGAEPVLL